MKGIFLKLEKGWVIEYIDNHLERNFISLHPSDHITNKTQRLDGKEVEFQIVKEYTDSHTNQVQTYAKLVKREDSLHFPTTDVNHIVDTNEMVDQVPDVRKMVEDTFKVWECCGMEECICKGNDVEKLAEAEYPIFDGDLLGIAHNQQNSRIDFIKGYKKAKETLLSEKRDIEYLKRESYRKGFLEAKETLYTEEQVREAIEMARGIKDDEMTFDISSIIGCGEVCTYGWKEEYTNEEIIQSFKQPKKD